MELPCRSSCAVICLVVALGIALGATEPAGKGASTASRGLLLVANKGDQTIGLIDPVTGHEIATVKESGFTVHELTVSPDGRTAYAPVYGNAGVGSPGTNGHSIDVIDIPSRRIMRVMDLGQGLRPHCPRIGPKDGLLYVSTELADSITVILPATGKVVGSVPTGQSQSHMFAISPDGRRAYTANVGPGTVSVLDLSARKLLAIVPVAKQIQRIAISPDGRWVFTADQHQPRLAVIRTHDNKLVRWVPLPGIGYGTAPTLEGQNLLIAIINKNEVAVLSLRTMTITHVIPVPHAPQEILVPPGGQVAYVSCSQTHQVAVLNLKNWKVEKLIPAGRDVDGMAWAAE